MKAEMVIPLQLKVFSIALQYRVQREWASHSSCEFETHSVPWELLPTPVAIPKAATPWGQNATFPGAGQGCKQWWELPLPITAMASWVLPRESVVG